MEKEFNNDFIQGFLENFKEKVVANEIVGKKNANGTFTASICMYDLAEYCKENKIDFNKELSKIFKKDVGLYSVNDFRELNKNYAYGTDTPGIQVELILSEFMRKEILKRSNPNAIWRRLTARVIPVDSQDVRYTYRKAVTEDMVNMSDVQEGQKLPELNPLNFGSELVRLGKVGGEIKFTYEVLDDAKINLLSAHYDAVAEAYDAMQDERTINVIRDGNTVDPTKGESGRGGAIKTSIPAISIPYLQTVVKYFEIYHHNLDVILVNLNTYQEILKQPDYNNYFQHDTGITGKTKTLHGMEVIVTELIRDNEMIALDTRKAVEKLLKKPLSSESDKDIETQKFIKTFWEISKPALSNENAATVITINADAEFSIEKNRPDPTKAEANE